MGRPDDIPKDVWAAATVVTSKQPTAFGWRMITEDVARAILAERERCAGLLVGADGYFNAPAGFYETLAANTTDDGSGSLLRVGDTGNWSAFMVEILKPWAAAIRKGGE